MNVAFFSCVCLRNKVSIVAAGIPRTSGRTLSVSLPVFGLYLSAGVSYINYWCERFVCDTEALYGSVVVHVLLGVSLVIGTVILLSLILPGTEA